LIGSHSAGENALDSRLRGNDGVTAGGKLAIPHFTLCFGCNTQQLLNTKQTIMTTWFISRHPGALDWAKVQGLAIDRHCTHLSDENLQKDIAAGDTVIGSLPVHLVAVVCQHGAVYYNLSLDLPVNLRGKELSAEELIACNVRLEPYFVIKTSR
jgi:CRISPR-associated protein Csx16